MSRTESGTKSAEASRSSVRSSARKKASKLEPAGVHAKIVDHSLASSELPAEVAAAMASAGKVENKELTARIKLVVDQVFFLRQKTIELEERLAKAKAEDRRLSMEVLPDLFDEAGVSQMTFDAAGNLPGLAIELKPFYSASISARWEPERRQEAYDWLEKHGHGSLIKTTIKVDFDKTDRKRANALMKELRKKKLAPEMASSVHASTLTSWLKAQVEKVKKVPPLDTIGGFVGREVKIKEK